MGAYCSREQFSHAFWLLFSCGKEWWPGTESNRRRRPFQGRVSISGILRCYRGAIKVSREYLASELDQSFTGETITNTLATVNRVEQKLLTWHPRRCIHRSLSTCSPGDVFPSTRLHVLRGASEPRLSEVINKVQFGLSVLRPPSTVLALTCAWRLGRKRLRFLSEQPGKWLPSWHTFKGCPAIWKPLPCVVYVDEDDDFLTESVFTLGSRRSFRIDLLTTLLVSQSPQIERG